MLRGLFPQPRPLTIMQNGVGVDSTGLLVRLFGLDGRRPLPREMQPDVVIHEDTGVEMPYTVEYREWLAKESARHGVPFIVIGLDDPCRAPSKRMPLDRAYRRQPKPGIPTRSRRSCTVAYKVQPVSNLLNGLYDLRRGRWEQEGVRHRIIVGIAADERHRCDGMSRAIDQNRPWNELLYPMVEHGITRADAERAIRRAGWESLGKSGCFCCPFQPVSHYWAISLLWPDLHRRSVEMEALALAHNPKLSLTGRGPLGEVIAAWVARRERLPDPRDVIAGGYGLKRGW